MTNYFFVVVLFLFVSCASPEPSIYRGPDILDANPDQVGFFSVLVLPSFLDFDRAFKTLKGLTRP